MAPIFAVLGTVVSAVGTIASASAAARQANAQAAQAEHAALVADQKAMQERATGQRQAFEKKRDVRFAQSTLLARAAASGASATDPTVLKLGSDISERGALLAGFDQASAETAGRSWESQADANRWQAGVLRDEASMAKTAGFIGAGSTILSGASSIFGKMAGSGSGGYVGQQPLTAPAGGTSVFGDFFKRKDPWTAYYG